MFIVAVAIITFTIIFVNIINKDASLTTGLAPKGPAVRECSNSIDDDNDGLIDYPNDPGCKRNNDRGETDLNLVCDDSLDATHDADLLADYRLSGGDPGCAYPQDTIETDGKCDDLIDNDADTHADFDNNGDSECLSFSDNTEDPRDYCDDTDGGINQGTKGTVSGEDASTPFIYADSCVDANNLNEYYCGDKPNSYDPLTVTILCPSGCSNGACQGSQPPTGCDNDGICESGQGEDCSSCSADCGVCPPPTSGADITAFNVVF